MKKKLVWFVLALVLVALVGLGIVLILRNLPDGAWALRREYMASNEEYRDFIAKYNSKNDGFASSFISIDLDNIDFISERTYIFEMVACVKDKEFYDSNTMFGNTKIYFSFTCEGSDCKIKCEYSKKDINFSVDDTFEMKKLETNDEELKFIDEDDPSSKYICGYQYALMINGNEEMSIKILSEAEIDEEKLNEICQLLLDNIVILE